jgi:hypothetical protein
MIIILSIKPAYINFVSSNSSDVGPDAFNAGFYHFLKYFLFKYYCT